MTKEELRYADINGLRIRLNQNTICLCQEEYIPHYKEVRANGNVSGPYWVEAFDQVLLENLEMKNLSSYGLAFALIRKPGADVCLPINDCDVCEPDVPIQSLETIL